MGFVSYVGKLFAFLIEIMAGKIVVSLLGGFFGLAGVLVLFYLADALKAAWKQV